MWMLLGLILAGTLAPVNDAGRDREFSGYLKKLRAAVAKRDEKGLRKLVSPDVIVGGFTTKDEKGWAKFQARWQPGSEDGELWDVLGDLLELGFFRESPETFVGPYLSWKFPRDLDPRQHLVVLRDALPLRGKPERDGPTVAVLAFDIVKRVGEGTGSGAFDWVEVETAAGKRGFVQRANVRSPLMARVQFTRIAGQWQMVALDRAAAGAID